MKQIKRLLAVVLAVCLLVSAAYAAEEERVPQEISPWAYGDLADIYALGMWTDEYQFCLLDPVTAGQLEAVTAAVSAKLALLGLPAREASGEALVVDSTRGGVVNALYQAAADYDFGLNADPAQALAGLDVVRGDGSGDFHLDRPCTLQEALVMARRLVLALYDQCGAGSKGLLWKAVNGDTTLYLLGTVHVDRGNIYPFHSSLRQVIETVQDSYFEIDFMDMEGYQAFYALQFYSDGTTLADHVSAEVYTEAVAAGATLGLTEEQVAAFKPWALANMLQTLALNSGSEEAGASGAEAPMLLDQYVYSSSVNLGHTIGQVESYQFQAEMFDGLSAEYQEYYLDGMIAAYYGEGEVPGEENSSAAQVDAMLSAWKARDADAFAAAYDKDAELEDADELARALLVDRDPGMIAWADGYLKQEGAHSGLLTVGAAHMVGQTGIVQGLIDLGYTVELVP